MKSLIFEKNNYSHLFIQWSPFIPWFSQMCSLHSLSSLHLHLFLFLTASATSLFNIAEPATHWSDTQAHLKNNLDLSSITPSWCLYSWDFSLYPCDNLFSDKFTCGFRCDAVISRATHVTELTLSPAGYMSPLVINHHHHHNNNLPFLQTLNLSKNYFSEIFDWIKQWNHMTSFPSAMHHVFSSSSFPSASPAVARAFIALRNSSNRARVCDALCTLKISSTRPGNGLGPQLVWKMISTTLCEGWPSRSSMMPHNEVIVVVVLLRERVMVVRALNSGLVVDDEYFELGCLGVLMMTLSWLGLLWFWVWWFMLRIQVWSGVVVVLGGGDDFVGDDEEEKLLWKRTGMLKNDFVMLKGPRKTEKQNDWNHLIKHHFLCFF